MFLGFKTILNLLPDVKARMVADPSGDDYNYYLDDNYDSDQLDILTRYKKYNGNGWKLSDH